MGTETDKWYFSFTLGRCISGSFSMGSSATCTNTAPRGLGCWAESDFEVAGSKWKGTQPNSSMCHSLGIGLPGPQSMNVFSLGTAKALSIVYRLRIFITYCSSLFFLESWTHTQCVLTKFTPWFLPHLLSPCSSYSVSLPTSCISLLQSLALVEAGTMYMTWCYPLEDGQPTQAWIPEANWLSFLQQPSTANGSSTRGGVLWSLSPSTLSFCSAWSHARPVQAFIATTSSHVQQARPIQVTLFTHHPP